MNKTYDLHGAESLIPLLRVIQREIGERKSAIRNLSKRIQGIDFDFARPESLRRAEVTNLQAEAATHRKEIRLAAAELERLGCAFDTSDPRTVHIPGANGTHEHGYTWRVGQAQISELATE